jgi:hypothetical protein
MRILCVQNVESIPLISATLQAITSLYFLKKQKSENDNKRFLSYLKDSVVTIPLLDACYHMPKYSTYFRKLLANRTKLEGFVTLGEECSAVVQRGLPEKVNDPGSFTLPCSIGSLSVKNVLADLGESINLMPYSMFQKLGYSGLKHTRMSIQLADRSVKYPLGICENVLVKVGKFKFPVDFVILEMEEDDLVPIILGRPFLATARAVIDVHDGKLTLRVGADSLTFDIKDTMNLSLEAADQLFFIGEVNELTDIIDECVDKEVEAGWLQEDPTPSIFERESKGEVNSVSFYPRFEKVEPLELCKPENKLKPSIIEPPRLELKELPAHLEYAFLQGEDQLPVIINATLGDEQKGKLIEVLKKYKEVIAWSVADIKGIDSTFCTHKILMEENYKPSVQPQRRVNPNIKEVVKKEVIKLLDAGLIYPISDSPWVSPVQVVPKNGGMTVVKNDKDELVPQRTVTGWRVCIDYRKLNDATRKDHFPLPFIDQMLERLAGHEYYCFLDGFSGYFQIPIAPEDQEKTTFTCPYGTFAYKRMPFGLCNAPATFQRCMTAIFHELMEDSMEVFMDDFSVFGDSFDRCLANLEKMLRRCEETNLVLNWEKCHFMVKEGIVLGQKISGSGIEVDKAKIEAISKLPYPTTVKEIRSFLGHAGFYRRFIKDFSKIARPMTQLLVKDAPFDFSHECKDAFDRLKRELTQAPIMVTPNWKFPFEIMCDASDYAVGAVLGQRLNKHFQPIYYASKTMNPAQENYTTTEKELLAVVFAFDKFRQYLVLSKTVVFTDHSALRYLFAKQDAKPRLIRWILLLQEFDVEIRDKKGAENLAADHLSRLENPSEQETDMGEIRDSFPDEQLMLIDDSEPWYADYANYLASRATPDGMGGQERKRFFSQLKYYFWDEPYLFRRCPDQIIRRCVSGKEAVRIMRECHAGPSGGHLLPTIESLV